MGRSAGGRVVLCVADQSVVVYTGAMGPAAAGRLSVVVVLNGGFAMDTQDLLVSHASVERLVEAFVAIMSGPIDNHTVSLPKFSDSVRDRTAHLIRQGDQRARGAGEAKDEVGSLAQESDEAQGGFFRQAAEWLGEIGSGLTRDHVVQQAFGRLATRLPLQWGGESGSQEPEIALKDLLAKGLEAASRQDALDIYGDLDRVRGRWPGLGADLTAWLYLLAPSLFPPLTHGLYRSAWEIVGPIRTCADGALRLWELADLYGNQWDASDLGHAAWFLDWFGAQSRDLLGDGELQDLPFFGFNRLVMATSMSTAALERLERDALERRFLLFWGQLGCGKTHTALALAKYLAGSDDRYDVLRFHPSMTYRDLAGSRDHVGVVVARADAAVKDPHHLHVLVMDALETVDPMAVLGDLAMAMEVPGQMVTLAAGRRILWPRNLVVIATLDGNGPDLASRHNALMRRFKMIRLTTDPLKLGEWLKRKGCFFKRIDLVAALRNANRFLEKRASGKVTMGHGLLMVEGMGDEEMEAYWNGTLVPMVLAHLGNAADPGDRERLLLSNVM